MQDDYDHSCAIRGIGYAGVLSNVNKPRPNTMRTQPHQQKAAQPAASVPAPKDEVDRLMDMFNRL